MTGVVGAGRELLASASSRAGAVGSRPGRRRGPPGPVVPGPPAVVVPAPATVVAAASGARSSAAMAWARAAAAAWAAASAAASRASARAAASDGGASPAIGAMLDAAQVGPAVPCDGPCRATSSTCRSRSWSPW